jgi:hypothetical protein
MLNQVNRIGTNRETGTRLCLASPFQARRSSRLPLAGLDLRSREQLSLLRRRAVHGFGSRTTIPILSVFRSVTERPDGADRTSIPILGAHRLSADGSARQQFQTERVVHAFHQISGQPGVFAGAPADWAHFHIGGIGVCVAYLIMTAANAWPALSRR